MSVIDLLFLCFCCLYLTEGRTCLLLFQVCSRSLSILARAQKEGRVIRLYELLLHPFTTYGLRWFLLSGILFLLALSLVGCVGDTSQGSSGSATPTPQPLASLHWCNKTPSMIFTDDSAPVTVTPVPANAPALGPTNGTPVAIKDWQTVKAYLGFTLYLPPSLPVGSCLLNAFASIRNSVYGSNFTITYLLPDHNSLTIAQAPQRSQSTTFQCSTSSTNAANTKGGTATVTASPAAAPLQLCTGGHDKTNITFSARWSKTALEQFFHNLSADVNWLPAS